MAMTALGAETSIEKFKKAGVKPFLLASFYTFGYWQAAICWFVISPPISCKR